MNTGCCCDNGTLTSDKTKKEKEKKKKSSTLLTMFLPPSLLKLCVFPLSSHPTQSDTVFLPTAAAAAESKCSAEPFY